MPVGQAVGLETVEDIWDSPNTGVGVPVSLSEEVGSGIVVGAKSDASAEPVTGSASKVGVRSSVESIEVIAVEVGKGAGGVFRFVSVSLLQATAIITRTIAKVNFKASKYEITSIFSKHENLWVSGITI